MFFFLLLFFLSLFLSVDFTHILEIKYEIKRWLNDIQRVTCSLIISKSQNPVSAIFCGEIFFLVQLFTRTLFFLLCDEFESNLNAVCTSSLYVSNSDDDDDYSVQLQSFNKTLWTAILVLQLSISIRLSLTSSFVSYNRYSTLETELYYVRIKCHGLKRALRFIERI